MKILALSLLLLSLTSCTTIPTQHGTAQFWGDYAELVYDDGTVHVKAKTMLHGPIVRAHWRGACTWIR